MGFYEAAAAAIMTYTGLTPAAFFTILALMVVVYKTVCGMFVDPEEYNKSASGEGRSDSMAAAAAAAAPRPPEPVDVGEITAEELKAYDGSDPSKPLLIAIKGQIYDVTPSRMFYGPGGPYAMFAGREASRAFALMSFDTQDLNGNLEGLSDSELEVLQDWEFKFMEKYKKVGMLVTQKTQSEIVEGADTVDEKKEK